MPSSPRVRPVVVRPGRRRLRVVVAAVAALALFAAGCGDDDDTTAGDEGNGSAPAAAEGEGDSDDPVADAPTVVATTSIWADIVRNVACQNLVEVQTVVPLGGDPHAFEPSLADRERMDDAALIVANGLLLEEGLEDTIDAAEDAGTPVFRVGDHIATIEFAFDDHGHEDEGDDHGHEDEGDDHDHAHDDGDPHVWFDPVRVSAALPELGEALVEHGGLDPAAVEECVTSYQAELADVDAEITELVAAVPDANRKLVTSHDSLGYFADRYGFEVIGTVIPSSSSLAETNPGQLEELAEVLEETGVPAVFAETQHSAQDTEALADRVGDVEVVTLFTGTLGDADSGAATYVEFLRTNATLVSEALS